MPLTPDELDRRFAVHAVTIEQKDRMGTIRDVARHVAAIVVRDAPECREQSLAITALEEAVFWANAAVSRPEHIDKTAYDTRLGAPMAALADAPANGGSFSEPKPSGRDRVELHEGVSYPVTFRATPGTGADGYPQAHAVMWSADLEIIEGISITAAAADPMEALAGLQAKILAGMPGAHGAVPVLPRSDHT